MSTHADRFGQTERPFTVNPICGVRAWHVEPAGDSGRLALVSLNGRRPWQPGENVAACHPLGWFRSDHPDGDRHVVAGKGCECGFYAYLSATDTHVRGGFGAVKGIVEGYGIVSVGAFGFRAARACVVALVRPDFKLHTATLLELDELLESYGVPVYDTIEEAIEHHPLSTATDYGVDPEPDASPSWPRSGWTMVGGTVSARAFAGARVRDPGPGPRADLAKATEAFKSLAEAIGVSAEQASRGTARILAALNEDLDQAAAKVLKENQPRRFARGGVISSDGNPLGPLVLDELAPPSPVELKRQRAERAAEARRAAGLRGSGGHDRRGRRR